MAWQDNECTIVNTEFFDWYDLTITQPFDVCTKNFRGDNVIFKCIEPDIFEEIVYVDENCEELYGLTVRQGNGQCAPIGVIPNNFIFTEWTGGCTHSNSF